MRTLSLRARLTLWYAVTLVVVVVIFGVDVLLVQQRFGVRRVDRELDTVHATLANVLREEMGELNDATLAATEARDAMASLGDAIAILDSRGEPLAAELNGLPLAELVPRGGEPAVRTITTASGEWRVHAEQERLGDTTVALVIARRLTDIAREQEEVGEAMLVVIPLALLLAGVGGWWLASVGLRPVGDMARRATSIPLTGLEDLGPPPRDEELGQLARAFNGLVARLRTPVSVIRTAADVALSRPQRDEAEYREALGVTAAQSRRLGRLVEDMLVLARADAGAYPLQPVDLYLDDVVEDCRRAVDVLA